MRTNAIFIARTLMGLETVEILRTYKCVVLFGSSDATLLNLSPTEVHLTVTRRLSNRHVHFPAFVHTTPGPLFLPERSLLLRGLSISDVAEMTKIGKAKI